MAADTIMCRKCAKDVPANIAVAGIFCSLECQQLHASMMAMTFKRPMPAPTQPVIKVEPTPILKDIPELPSEDFEEDIGKTWQRAGQKYMELTERALRQEKRRTGKRSIILAGNGVNISVKNDQLVLKNGITFVPQEVISETLARAVHDVSRVVCAVPTGSISFAAIKWMYEQEISFCILDKDGNLMSETVPQKSPDIRVKRCQYNISPEREIEIARWIVLGKILGQAKTYQDSPELSSDRTDSAFMLALNWLSFEQQPEWLKELNTIRLYESRVALAYFAAWHNVALNWIPADKEKVPEHWRTVGNRISPLGHLTARKAVNPANAILNYAYGILENSARTALLAQGLDIDVGILHTDMLSRNSLVYDLMELERGQVDNLVLRFLRKQQFHKADFIAVVDGTVRLHPEFARAVIALCSISPDILLEHARHLKNMIMANGHEVEEIGND